MNKLNYLIAAMLLSATVNAQDSVPFKMKFLPRHTYTVTTKTTNKAHIDVAGKTNTTTGSGKKAPKNIDQTGTADMVYTIKTGPAQPNGKFAYAFTITKYSGENVVNGKAAPAKVNLVGFTNKGECTADGRMHMESMAFDKIDPAKQKSLMQMVNKINEDVKFPEKPMKVGESFTQDKPLSLPSADKNLKMDIRTTYTLKAVKGNLAYFDIKQETTGDFTAKKNNAKASFATKTNGTGKMVYDIKQNYAVENENNIDMKMNMAIGGMDMVVNSKSTSISKTQITAN